MGPSGDLRNVNEGYDLDTYFFQENNGIVIYGCLLCHGAILLFDGALGKEMVFYI